MANRMAAALVRKAEDEDIEDGVLNGPGIDDFVREAQRSMAAASEGAGMYAFNGIELNNPVHELPEGAVTATDVANRLHTFATDFAKERGANLVGKTVNENGELVDNPDAKWAISDKTRDVVNQLVTDAVALHWDMDQLADKLTDTGVFSDYRAEMIARTEISFAQNDATLEMGRLANERGVPVKKTWTTDGDPCPLCQAAEAEGVKDIDEDFGDAGDGPPLHPNCMCEVELVISDEYEPTPREERVAGYEPDDYTPELPENADPRDAFKARKGVIKDWANRSPLQTIGDVVAAAPDDQARLVAAGRQIAKDLDIKLKENGSKVGTQKGINRVIEKAEDPARGGQVAQVTDVVRMTFVIDRPEQADEAIERLAQRYEIVTEPWKLTDLNYADRAINVRMPDGLIGGVQFMDQKMLDAKGPGGGHVQYKIMQDTAPDGPHPDPEAYDAAIAKSEEIYKRVLDSYSGDWKAALGIGGKAP